jgi:lipopolysaccharide export system permease protein
MAGSLTVTATLLQVMLFLSVSVGSLDLDLFSITKFMLLCIPANFVYVSPIALICTILYFFHILSSDNELLIFELSGISKRRLVLPVFGAMFIMAFISLVMCCFINPIAQKQLLLQRETLQKSMIGSILKEKTFVKISNKLILYIEKRLDSKNLRGVIIYDKNNPAEVTTIFAEKGSFIDDQDQTVFKLHDGSRQTLTKNNLQTLYFKSLIFDVSEYTKKFLDLNETIDAQPINKLVALKRTKASNINFQKKISQEIHRRISWPLLNISLPILFLFSVVRFGDGRERNLKKINIFISTVLAVLNMALYFSLINRSGITTSFFLLIYLNILFFVGLGLWLLKSVGEQRSIMKLLELPVSSFISHKQK